MTQTFSEILEEKIYADSLIQSDVTASFYSGTADSTCLYDLLSTGFQLQVRRAATYAFALPKDFVGYEFNETQQQALNFFNSQLQGHRQLLGRFSIYKLQRVYRLLAKKLHPDLGGSNESFRELHTQYKILLDFVIKIK